MPRRVLIVLSHCGMGDTSVKPWNGKRRRKRPPKVIDRSRMQFGTVVCFAAVSVSLSGYLIAPDEMRTHSQEHPHTHTDIVEVPRFGGSSEQDGKDTPT